MSPEEFNQNTRALIDGLKSVCADYGLGNDGNEFKIITQTFLYKFLNDKFAYEVKQLSEEVRNAGDNWAEALAAMSEDDYQFLVMELSAGTATLYPKHFLSTLYQKQNEERNDEDGITAFNETFDDTLQDIATVNSDIFSVSSASGESIKLFEPIIRSYITDPSDRDGFARAIVNKLIPFSFEPIFSQNFDFYSAIFEYLIKDYNSDSGGKYAEYYTPHAVAKIMASILAPEEKANVTCYDPSAGSGTLLMNLAHALGEQNCTIYTQDISQKSSNLLRLNLILNNLVGSIPNVIKGNTILEPYPFHQKTDGAPEKFDFIVSNPPFKLDFTDWRESLDTEVNKDRFFAGIPKVPAKKKESMAIYQLFLQHIIDKLSPTGKAAIVVPTGFLTAQSGIDKKVRQKLVEEKILAGVVSMPSNIFASTGTNVSIVFVDKGHESENAILIDASKLGKTIKEDKNQKTVLRLNEEESIIDIFLNQTVADGLSVSPKFSEIKEKNYSFSAGQYFEVKIEYVDITETEFQEKLSNSQQQLSRFFTESKSLEKSIAQQLTTLQFNEQ